MGMHVNPGNEGFAGIVSDDYVDKTRLIPLVNGVIGTPRKLVAVTRPRRFGKSFAAESLVAYYSCGCDSRSLFQGLDISRDPNFNRHLNAYNVIRLDMTEFWDTPDVVESVTQILLDELKETWPDTNAVNAPTEALKLTSALTHVVDATGRQFVFVIDEWDAPLRERRSKSSQEAWVYFLRLLFKNFVFTAKAIAACYITGILPIVRYGTQSALSDFWEYTFLHPRAYAPFVGFTEPEVQRMAKRSCMTMDELRNWYDGYELRYFNERTGKHETIRCYAPYSVAKGIAASHDNGCAHQFYNNEQALRAVVRVAYIAAADHYAEVQEFPSGHGVADIAYIPRRGEASPALLIELKWNRRPTDALEQILQKDYANALREWGGPILLVGVTYDPKTREHSCHIEEA